MLKQNLDIIKLYKVLSGQDDNACEEFLRELGYIESDTMVKRSNLVETELAYNHPKLYVKYYANNENVRLRPVFDSVIKKVKEGKIDGLKDEVEELCNGLYEEEQKKKELNDKIEKAVIPIHYGGKNNPYECIKVLKNWLSKEEYEGFLKGNTLKYLCRVGKKDDDIQELKKAKWYLEKLIENKEEK